MLSIRGQVDSANGRSKDIMTAGEMQPLEQVRTLRINRHYATLVQVDQAAIERPALTPNSTRHLHEVASSLRGGCHGERGAGFGRASIVHARVQT